MAPLQLWHDVEVPTGPAIYLLDDDPSVLKSLSRLLAAEGYAARSFLTVVDFIQTAVCEPTKLAVLDHLMPGLTGLQVQECLQRLAPETQVILISGTNPDAVREQAMRAGAYDCLTKPFDDETFLSAIRGALAASVR